MLEEKLICEMIRGAIEVHRALGPGLLEAAYEDCLCHELRLRGLRHERQVEMSLTYRGLQVPGCYRADVIVEGSVLIERKAVERIIPLHPSQLLTLSPMDQHPHRVAVQLQTSLLKDGIVRRVL